MRSVYFILSWVLAGLYVAAPIVAIVLSTRRQRTNVRRPYAFLGSFVAGAILGVSFSVVYALAVKGRISITQAALAAYFGTALLIILRWFDAGLRAIVWRVAMKPATHDAEGEIKPRPRPVVAAIGNIVRVVVLFGFGLPFVMAAIMAYRPKVLPADTPLMQLGYSFESVSFRATDGTKIAAWWMPGQVRRGATAHRTVIVCHGLGANKSNQLILARKLVPAGYNVLAIDHRAHGESGGQLCSFGDLERYDVLGAVRWLREDRPDRSQQIFGVGASQGGVALIAAAATDSAEGRAIDGIAIYGGYDELNTLVQTLSRRTFLPPMNWVVEKLALPIVSAHTGADLTNFRPGELAARIWPRPILVIHGLRDAVIDFRHGKRLFEGATQPKESMWIDRGDHNSIVESEAAAERVRRFFDNARPVQVI